MCALVYAAAGEDSVGHPERQTATQCFRRRRRYCCRHCRRRRRLRCHAAFKLTKLPRKLSAVAACLAYWTKPQRKRLVLDMCRYQRAGRKFAWK